MELTTEYEVIGIFAVQKEKLINKLIARRQYCNIKYIIKKNYHRKISGSCLQEKLY